MDYPAPLKPVRQAAGGKKEWDDDRGRNWRLFFVPYILSAQFVAPVLERDGIRRGSDRAHCARGGLDRGQHH